MDELLVQINSFCKSGRESDRKNQGDVVPKPLCPFVQRFGVSGAAGVCSGQGSDPKNRAGNGESSSCELENVDFGGFFRNTP